ncbi:unnamed protein product, partial [Rotaria sp. Silwood1]
WQLLYRHIKTFDYFDKDISEYLFDRLQDVDMIGYENQLYKFIIDHLFEIWPSMINNDLLESIRYRIVQLIQILINNKTNDSNQLVEQITERICANTPVNNVRGHLCFFVLLHDLLPIYYKAVLISAIKKINLNMLIWYVDFIMDDNDEIDNKVNHRFILLSILKYT